MADHARRCAHSMGHGGDVAALPHSRTARPSPLCNLNRLRPVKEFAQCFRAQAVGLAREANMYRARRQTMRGANKWFVALSTALALAAVSSQTVAQDSAARAARDAAIQKCANQAHREVPGGESQDMQRSDAYKACMVSAGFQP